MVSLGELGGNISLKSQFLLKNEIFRIENAMPVDF